MRAWIGWLLVAAFSWLHSPTANAQSTDGFHEIQVFPVVVDSTSFTQRFSFRAISSGTDVAELHPRYYPAQGTTQSGPIDCPAFDVNFAGATFDGLRALCPALAAGSQFGFLVIEQRGSQHLAFSGFSRVSNHAGAGFAIEAFPAHTFTSAFSTVAGLRRKAASAGAPAYQSNCFIGLLAEHAAVESTTRVQAGLLDSAGQELGAPVEMDFLPGQLVRLLDVFSAVGASAGDHDGATLVARPILTVPDAQRPGILAFCTVQDNTSFGADFRIAKQEYGYGTADSVDFSPASYDGHVMRASLTFANPGPPGTGLPFTINVGMGQQNTHSFYFRHPDWISCELLGAPGSPGAFERLLPEDGLEMRLLAWDAEHGYTVLVGGAGVVGWDRLYLGDKRQRAEGSNTQYFVQVEDNSAMGALGAVNYGLRCWSGSGHTRGEIIRYQRAANDF